MSDTDDPWDTDKDHVIDYGEGVLYNKQLDKVKYKLWEAQAEAIEACQSGDYEIVVFRGGYRSGKSMTGARWILFNASRIPDSNWLILGVNSSRATETTYKVFMRNLPGENTVDDSSDDSGPENSPMVSGYNRKKNLITLTNGATIKLGSADEWNRYAGAEYDGVWADEVAHYKSDLHALTRMLVSRLTSTKEGSPRSMLWTSTGNGFNQFYEISEKQINADGEPLGLKIYNVIANTLNNPFLDKEIRERQKRMYENSDEEEQGLYGGFSAAEGRVYDKFQRKTHVVSEEKAEELVEDDWRIYGYDAGWDDPRVLLEIGKTHTGQYIVLDEFYESEAFVEDCINWLEDKPQGKIYCEHEPSDRRKFQRQGWGAVKADKSLDGGIATVKHRLTEDNDGRVGLLVSEACENTIQEFLGYTQDDVGGSNADDHALDSLRYAVHTQEDSGGTGGTVDVHIIN